MIFSPTFHVFCYLPLRQKLVTVTLYYDASFLLRLQYATQPLFMLFVEIFLHGKFDYHNWGDKIGIKPRDVVLWGDWQPAFPSATGTGHFPSLGLSFPICKIRPHQVIPEASPVFHDLYLCLKEIKRKGNNRLRQQPGLVHWG